MATVTLENGEPSEGLKLDRILVPVDFSNASEIALRHALGLYRAGGDPIEVLHVWNVSSYAGAGVVPEDVTGGPPETLAVWVAEHAAASMNRFLDRVLGEGKEDPRVRPVLESGDAIEVIVAKSAGFDAIYIGAHDDESVASAILGSVAEGVIADAKCPVFTVRP